MAVAAGSVTLGLVPIRFVTGRCSEVAAPLDLMEGVAHPLQCSQLYRRGSSWKLIKYTLKR